jgi:membrane-bound metal-dependent hydrolase YbcI (DUF457 family)
VDPVSHAIFGQTLVTAVGRQPALIRGRTVAAVLGALAPDIDALLMPFGWDLYLRAHEIGTHSLVGTVVLAGLLTVLVGVFVPTSRFADLLWPAWLGCVSHLALDIVSGARIRIAWPALDAHVTLPLVAMAEPWLVAIFLAGAIAMGLSRRRRRQSAVAVCAIVVLLLAAKSVALSWALATLPPPAAGAPVLARVIEARWASVAEWNVFDRQPDMLRQWTIRADGTPMPVLSWPVVGESGLVSESRSFDTVKNFLRAHDLGFAARLPADDGGTRILWSDLRYCWRPDSAAAADATLEPVLTSDTPAGVVRLACGLWFGGRFDRDGRPVTQLVKVGGWWQTRAPAP